MKSKHSRLVNVRLYQVVGQMGDRMSKRKSQTPKHEHRHTQTHSRFWRVNGVKHSNNKHNLWLSCSNRLIRILIEWSHPNTHTHCLSTGQFQARHKCFLLRLVRRQFKPSLQSTPVHWAKVIWSPSFIQVWANWSPSCLGEWVSCSTAAERGVRRFETNSPSGIVN